MRSTLWIFLLLLAHLPLQSSQDTVPLTSHDVPLTSHDDLPPIIQLAHLFDDVQHPPQSFPRWPQDQQDLNVLKVSIIKYQEVVQEDIDRLESLQNQDQGISDFFY